MGIRRGVARGRGRKDMCRGLAAAAAAMVLCAPLWPRAGQAQAEQCRSDAQSVAAALDEIRHAVDPCGESAQVLAVLEQVERCTGCVYRICTSPDVDRNVFDRPLHVAGEVPFATIVWNPELRSDLEAACAGEPGFTVRRHPTASLLHELVHVAQECAGLNPGEHELEAVRIENIFRRAIGLCQRTGYGDDPLPPQMVRTCSPHRCTCARPDQIPAPASGGDRPDLASRELQRGSERRSGDRPE